MYATPTLGAGPAFVFTGGQVIDFVTGLFKKKLDAGRKATTDALVNRIMKNVQQITVPGTDPYIAWMTLRCLSGDQSAFGWYKSTHPEDTTAPECGWSNPAAREYAQTFVKQILGVKNGGTLTSNPPAPIDPILGTPIISIPVNTGQLSVGGIPVMPLMIGAGVLLFALGNSRGRR